MNVHKTACLLSVIATFVLIANSALEAVVTRFEILNRQPFADGREFGEVGAYDRLIGRVHLEIDPNQERNQEIIDLRFAPTNERGRVEFQSDLDLLVPRDLSRARGAALYDVNNRGNKLALRFFNNAAGGNDIADAGHGFLMRQGWIVVWSGWDGELLPGGGRLQLSAPTASGERDKIVGRVRYEILTDSEQTRVSVAREGHGAYRPTTAGSAKATLTWRRLPSDPRVPIPRDQFYLHVLDVPAERPGQLPRVELELPAGFQRGYLYELIYEAQDPLVHGVCFAAVRDLMSAFKHGTGMGNPLLHEGRPVARRTHGFGVSQSGRFLREFLYSGFNADEQGRQVFDGLIPHVAGGGLGSFNHRFAQPTAYNTQHEYHDWHCDRFPFAYGSQTDPVTGRVDGILTRAEADKVAPFVLHTQSAAEYWSRSGSLVHTDPRGEQDAEIPDRVRVYTFGGTQHGPATWPPGNGVGQAQANPGDYTPLLRGLLTALDDWCRAGTAAPPSVYPRIAAGELVDWQQDPVGFPAIPGIRYPEVIQQPPALDLGPRWLDEGIIDHQPPKVTGHYRVLAARTDGDGNGLGCLLPPEVAVPLATYTGWNLRDTAYGTPNQLVKLAGSYIPFPVRRFDRQQTSDPRRSVEERYAGLADYERELRDECKRLAEQRYLLNEDVDRIVTAHVDRARALMERIQQERVFAVEGKPELIAEAGAGEGPAWHPELGLLTSGNGHIHRHDGHGKTIVFRRDAGTNGLLFDQLGRLLACEPAQRRVTRTEPDGTITVLTDNYQGQPYNSPNDLTVDSKGRIYFSDPRYGDRQSMELLDDAGRRVEGVYRIDPDGGVTRIVTHEVDRPNGVLVTADDRYLYVADNNNNAIGGARILYRFNLQADGSVDPNTRTKVYDWQSGRGPDGMAQDVTGRLYVAAGLNEPHPPAETAVRHLGGVYVFHPDGRLIDIVPIPRDEVTNCAFGGDDLSTLFITAGGSLWTIRTAQPGRLAGPAP